MPPTTHRSARPGEHRHNLILPPMKFFALTLLLLVNAYLVNEFKKQAVTTSPPAATTAAEPRSLPQPLSKL